MADADSSSSAVRDFFKGANIFITGATGFLGMALIEKILRVCPDAGNIYLLVRPKKGKEIATRVEELTKNPLYEKLIELRGSDVFQKLVAVAGDVGEDDLGLSPADKKLLVDNVNVVFHSAATLDFEATFKATVNINLLGTRRVVQLCKEMSHLKALVHVSSAYVNSNRKGGVEEVVYPAPEDAEKVIGLATSLSEEALDDLTSKMLNDHPNMYTFTKALAEHEVVNAVSQVPSAIIRPSMITCAWKEPVPGWTNSKNGPTGFIMGAAKGVVRRLPISKDLVYDYIPVDIVINELMVAAWHVGSTRPQTTPVYHCTSSTINPFRWVSVEHKLNGYLHKYPLKSAVWYPTLKLLPSLLLFRISAIFVHFIPAYILDTVTRIFGGRPILVRLHTNVSNSLGRLAPFIFSEWRFQNSHTKELQTKLTGSDKETFNLDISNLNWEEYFVNMAQGVRMYLNNEHPRTLPAAKRKDSILMVMNVLVQALVFALIWWIGSIVLGTTMTKSSWIVVVAYILFSFI
ncbi:putative fatty acyl-CoA reductase CG8306 [Periplaneta americana]|uniref:putative fatty acyl-CoA reductase CG8306 n=1 Tax=Periplaneta americana TaxID=6978 RepID=UPI0037E78B44